LRGAPTPVISAIIMAKTPKLRLLKDKQRDIDEQMARLKGMLAELEVQASELKIAERVLASLSTDDDEEDEGPTTIVSAVGSAAGSGHAQAVGVAAINGNGEAEHGTARKPDGIPTMPEMIQAALENNAATGRGLEPKQMTEYIDKRWWKGVPSNAVGPIAWRMYMRHELNKRGKRYYLPNPGNQAAEGAE
jgi:hypothetical protein